MPSPDRRATGRRRAWGRGPHTLRLESLERRALMAAGALPDLVNSALTLSSGVADWGNTLEVQGQVTNQGGAATTTPVDVGLYASPVRGINDYSVKVGDVTIPAGLAPGRSIPYQVAVQVPQNPIPKVNGNGGTLYIATWVNPGQAVPESNYRNDRDIGPPHDVAPVLIASPKPSDLVGTTLAVSAPTTTWGSTVTVTAQVTNEGAGTSPPTTALLSLTPQGFSYGGSTSIGIGKIPIPALGPYQTYNVAQSVTLPAVEPLSITNYTSFGLTMTQDSDYLTNRAYPSQPDQGLGYDQASMTITTDPNSTAVAGPRADLAASTIMGPTGTIRWGRSFTASTDVQNLGQGAARPFPVYFVLTGQSGSLTNAIYLGQTMIAGLAPGASQHVTQSLTLPTRLPAGFALNGVGYGRVAVIVDPQNFIDETLKSNDSSVSAPFIVRLPGGSSGTVPTQAAAGTLPSVETVAQQAQAGARRQAALNHAAKVKAAHPARAANQKLHRKAPPRTDGIVNKGVSLATELTKLPHQIQSVITKAL